MGNTTEVLQEKLKMEKYYVVRKTKAPAMTSKKGPHGYWRAKFESMKVGEWFVVPKEDRTKVAASAWKHMKGRYSLYRINTKGDCCFLKKA